MSIYWTCPKGHEHRDRSNLFVGWRHGVFSCGVCTDEARKADAETRRSAPDDGLDQKITPLTKGDHG